MSLPNGGHREDAIRTKLFEVYIRDHIVNWFTWAQNNKLGIERMEELILVTGCTLVTSWASAVLVDHNMEAEITLSHRNSSIWTNIRGPVVYHNSLVRFTDYVYTTCTDVCCLERTIYPRLVINASLSEAYEQCASSSKPDQSELLEWNTELEWCAAPCAELE